MSSWMLDAKILYKLETLKTICWLWYEICCILWIYMTGLTSFFLFNFTFELVSFFMVMINSVKIELINATENCRLNIFSVGNFFYQLNHSLSIPFSCGQAIWIWYRQTYRITYWVKSAKWKLLVNKMFSWKRIGNPIFFFFWPSYIHWVLLIMYGEWSFSIMFSIILLVKKKNK